jgi:hypothetical protein
MDGDIDMHRCILGWVTAGALFASNSGHGSSGHGGMSGHGGKHGHGRSSASGGGDVGNDANDGNNSDDDGMFGQGPDCCETDIPQLGDDDGTPDQDSGDN